MSLGSVALTGVGVVALAGVLLVGSGSAGGGSGSRAGSGAGHRPRPSVALPRRWWPAPNRGSAAGWATPRDLRSLVVPPAVSDQADAGRGRLILGKIGRRIVAAECTQSVIVFGPTQSYKTSAVAVPAILEWRGPVMATSVKTDLIEDTIGHRRSVGTVGCFDPSGVTGLGSVGWSPLPAARTWPGARRVAATLTEVSKASLGTMSDGDFWYATAARMLAPLVFAAAFGRREMADVVRWVGTGEEDEVLDLLHAAGVAEALTAARSAFGKEDRQRSSIYTTVETILEPFAEHPTVPPRGSQPPLYVDPAALVSGMHTLYLCAPAHDQRRLTPLFVSVVRQVIEHVYEQVARTGRPLDPPLLVVLDEAANVAPLHDLDELASTAAGHGIQLVTIWHDLAQLSARFGPRAPTVTNNHRAKIFLSGMSDPSTLDYASHLIGDHEVLLPATTNGGRGGSSTTRSPATRRLAPPDELRRIAPGRGVLVYGNLPPAMLTLRTWFGDRRLKDMSGKSAEDRAASSETQMVDRCPRDGSSEGQARGSIDGRPV